jgi:hypothetical protein
MPRGEGRIHVAKNGLSAALVALGRQHVTTLKRWSSLVSSLEFSKEGSCNTGAAVPRYPVSPGSEQPNHQDPCGQVVVDVLPPTQIWWWW